MHENFQYPKFLETMKSIPKNFPVLWVKKIDAKTGQPPSFINSSLSTPEKFWNTDLTLTKFLGSCEARKLFDKTICSPHSHENLRCQSFFETKKGSPCEICRDYETKVFQRRTAISPLYAKNFFDDRIFLTQWMVPPRKFSALWDEKIFNRKQWYPSHMHINFPYRNFSETLKSFPTKNFGTLSLQNISGESSNIAFLSRKGFRYPNRSNTMNGYPRKFSGTVRRKKFNTNKWHPFLMLKNCRYPIMSEILNSYPNKLFGTLRL